MDIRIQDGTIEDALRTAEWVALEGIYYPQPERILGLVDAGHIAPESLNVTCPICGWAENWDEASYLAQSFHPKLCGVCVNQAISGKNSRGRTVNASWLSEPWVIEEANWIRRIRSKGE